LNAFEKRRIETQLVSMGLAGLQTNGDPTPELVEQLAAIVNGWQGAPNRHGEWIDKHKFLRDMLAECDAKYRVEMYEAIKPHLKFAVKPLAHYESMTTERMGGLISKRVARVEGRAPHPIEIGGKKYRSASASEATNAIATLHCQKCWKKKRFVADTPVGALIAARNAGWKRVPEKWTCPSCVKKLEYVN
jgi:rubredoxin